MTIMTLKPLGHI